MAKEESQGIKSIEIGYRILEEMASFTEAISVTELAKRCDMSKSKIHHYLVSFCRVGLAQKEEDGRYSLGPKLAFLGLKASKRLDIHKIIEPHLKELGTALGETTAYAAWAENHGPYWALKYESSKSLGIAVREGAPLSITSSSTGRLFAAFYDPSKIAPFLERAILEKQVVRSQYDAEIDQIRERGYSVADGTFSPGFIGISAPIFNNADQMIGAITVVGISGIIDDSPQSPIVAAVLRKAQDISKALRI